MKAHSVVAIFVVLAACLAVSAEDGFFQSMGATSPFHHGAAATVACPPFRTNV